MEAAVRRNWIKTAVSLAALLASGLAIAPPASAAAQVSADDRLAFPKQRVGGHTGGFAWNISNTGDSDSVLGNASILAGDKGDFTIVDGGTCGSRLRAHQSCYVRVDFTPQSAGNKTARIGVPSEGGSALGTLFGEALDVGYLMVASNGKVYPFGGAEDLGSPATTRAVPAVDIEASPRGLSSYWVVDSLGRVSSYGPGQTNNGNAIGLQPGETVTSMSATRRGQGYWLFTTKGRVLPMGDAPFLGDMSGITLNGPVLDSIPTPSGNGYYMVASDGGVFTFGDAAFAGSMGAAKLNAPVQSLVPDADGVGYWLVASDGGIFAFDAEFYGSMGATRLNKPVTGMVGSSTGKGYMMVAEDGGIFTFGDVAFRGSLGASPPPFPITSVTPLAPINYQCC
jgi:hypothetical protein